MQSKIKKYVTMWIIEIKTKKYVTLSVTKGLARSAFDIHGLNLIKQCYVCTH